MVYFFDEINFYERLEPNFHTLSRDQIRGDVDVLLPMALYLLLQPVLLLGVY